MNTCIKCGCDDAYPSLPPCPTPVDCPNPQPCAEFFNAQCVRYTLPDIMCGLNIVVAQDSSIADALESIVLFFCTNFSNSVQSVTGLNTDNTDPLNPIVKISVDGITITGLGTPASPLIAVGGVDGSGIIDYVARWTPDATTLGTGVIRDNGSTVGIGSAPNAVAQLYVSSAVGGIVGITTTSGYQGVVGTSNGVGVGTNSGVKGSAAFGAVNAAVEGQGTSGVGTVAYGGWFTATGVGSNYSLKLQDGTQGSGRFLKSVTANGEANWADITAADITGGIDGSGIADYVARWSDANTLTTGLIKDDGTNTSIGGALDVTHKLLVLNSTIANTITAYNSYIGTGNQLAINAQSFGAGTGRNIAVQGFATTNTVLNVGVKGITSGASAVNLGGWFAASGATNNYSLRLTDGTEGVGKVLTCITANGEAQWQTPSGGVSGSGTADYLARWTPSGTQLGIGLIRDDGTNVGINAAPGTIAKVTVANTTVEYTVDITNGNTGIGAKAGIRSITSGVNGTGFNTGATFTARNNTLFNIGVVGESDGASTKNIGGFFTATGGTDNYSIRLQDTTEGVGKVLTCMTATGEANWVTPSGVAGSGTNNYVARWTPDGATLGTGLIRDNNTSVGIGVAPTANYRLHIETSTQLYGLYAKTSLAGTGNQVGLAGFSDGLSTGGQNAGVVGLASGNSNINIGGSFSALSATVGTNIGVYAQVQSGANNYAAQLRDGTEGVGKMLASVTATGEANWDKVTSTYTTGASGSFVVGAQTITVTNGLITSIV